MEYTDIPFQELADNIARDFIDNGTPIEDGVVRIAESRNLTPEEVKRLVEKSNTAASVLYLKGSDNKKGTFALASVQAVLGKTHPEDGGDDEEPEPEEEEKTASEFPVTREVLMEKDALLEALVPIAPLAYPLVGMPAFIWGAKKMRDFSQAMSMRNYAAQQAFRKKQLLTAAAVGTPVAAGGAAVAANNMDAMADRHDQQNRMAKLRAAIGLQKTSSDTSESRLFYQINRSLSEAKREKTACEQRLSGDLKQLRHIFLYKQADFDRFAADSQQVFPKTAASVVKGLCKCFNITPKQVKTAAYINDLTEPMQIMRRIDADMHKHAELSGVIDKLEDARKQIIDPWKGQVLQ